MDKIVIKSKSDVYICMNIYINVSSISSVIERANKVRELIDVCMDSRVRPGNSTRAMIVSSFE